MAVIFVTDSETNSSFERRIPAAYFFHLRWLLQEGYVTEEATEEQKCHSRWIRQVLDCFAEEVVGAGDMSDWRSKVLTPVLVRAFFKVNDFSERAIARSARDEVKPGRGGGMTITNWEGFYFNIDVVAPRHRDWWMRVKQVDPERHQENNVARSVGGSPDGCISSFMQNEPPLIVNGNPQRRPKQQRKSPVSAHIM